ncbi:MAG TPA: hypothetical protein VF546_11140 [Pyrinomonadaceae bacterium]|jgi:hypothetical protein
MEACRDCGAGVAAGARGCPVCARNLEAERMLARYLWLAAAACAALALLAALLLRHGR